jgi:pimeloyl-ACP methyl ester carboxylesterase
MEQQRFLTTDGDRLGCVAFGGSGPPALLLHGLYGRATEWRGTAQWLSASHDVYALDQRGHGLSAKGLADFSRSAQVDDAIRTIEALARGPALLVGQSMGGVTAFLAAACRPDLVTLLVVIEAHAHSDRSAKVPASNWLSSWPLPFRTLDDARDFFCKQGLKGDVWVDVLVDTADGFRPEFRADDMGAASADLKDYDYWSEWRAIACPTLLVGGSASWLSQQPMREMAGAISKGRYVCIESAGHDVHLDAPEALRVAIETFLRDGPSS